MLRLSFHETPDSRFQKLAESIQIRFYVDIQGNEIYQVDRIPAKSKYYITVQNHS